MVPRFWSSNSKDSLYFPVIKCGHHRKYLQVCSVTERYLEPGRWRLFKNESVCLVLKIFEDNKKSAESKKTVPDESLDDDPRPRRGSFCSIGEAQRIGNHGPFTLLCPRKLTLKFHETTHVAYHMPWTKRKIREISSLILNTGP